MFNIPLSDLDNLVTAIGFFVFALAILVAVLLNRNIKIGNMVQSINSQVTNNHGTNLREDIDSVREDISELKKFMEEMRHDIREIRSDASRTHSEIFQRVNHLEKEHRYYGI